MIEPVRIQEAGPAFDDEVEETSLRPRRLDEFIGQDAVREQLGVALDVLVAMLVLGVFFFQIREQFDSLDLHHLESLKEEQ